ncbi:MAG: hypothetical protein KAJ48_06735, partial [Elusimicrobiales bacterium]|nr:hypothetical protein [Elusimicrobiales bacterium]
MDMSLYTLVILPALIIIGTIIMIFLVYLGNKSDFEKLKTFLNGQIEAGFFTTKFIGIYKGSPFEIKRMLGGQRSRSKLILKMRTHKSLSIEIYTNYFIFPFVQRIAEKIGETLSLLGKHIITGDRIFDEMFRVFSSPDMRNRSFLSSAENRTRIQVFFLDEYK